MQEPSKRGSEIHLASKEGPRRAPNGSRELQRVILRHFCIDCGCFLSNCLAMFELRVAMQSAKKRSQFSFRQVQMAQSGLRVAMHNAKKRYRFSFRQVSALTGVHQSRAWRCPSIFWGERFIVIFLSWLSYLLFALVFVYLNTRIVHIMDKGVSTGQHPVVTERQHLSCHSLHEHSLLPHINSRL